MDNEKKCNKYEGLFVFRSEEELNKHLEECPECREEHEKLLKVSNLVKEVAPAYLAKKEKNTFIKRAACVAMIFTFLTAFTGYKVYDEYSYQANSGDDYSYITELGLPTDDYGFFEI
ncbi:hypothetical protein IJ182_00590 [bacterium]|nr:hypothetical protein [bacterium]